LSLWQVSVLIGRNNLIDGYGTHYAIALWDPKPRRGTKFVNGLVANNLVVNGSTLQLDSTVNVSNNVTGVTTTQAQGYFVSYATNSGSNDYHLLNIPTLIAGMGLNLPRYFSTDKDGGDLIPKNWT
jgi:hypothetical protein